MKTAFDLEKGDLEKGDKEFLHNVREYGWAATHVFEDDEGPGFSYTTGFWTKFKAPELIMFSLPSELIHQIFWNFYHDLEGGKQFPAEAPVSNILEGFDVILQPVATEHFPTYLGWNRWFYRGDNFECLQVVFPDKSGVFPWDAAAHADFAALQPSLATHSQA